MNQTDAIRWHLWPEPPGAEDAGQSQWFPDASSLRLVGTSARHAWATAYDKDNRQAHWSAQFSRWCPDEELTASVAVATRSGARLFCGSTTGIVRTFDTSGMAGPDARFEGGAIRFLTSAVVRGEPLIVAAFANRVIQVFDETLTRRAAFETPGSMLSLDVAVSDRGVEIVGGSQHDPNVYLWSLERVIQSHDATPRLILGGGSKPAYAARFIAGLGRRWVAHGSWDGRVYLYHLELATSRSLSPVYTLEADAPVYAITTFVHHGVPYVLASGEDGSLTGWGLDPSDGSCRIHVRFWGLPSVAKDLRVALLGPEREVLVLAMCRDGSVWQLRPDDPCGRLQTSVRWLSPNVVSLDVMEGR